MSIAARIRRARREAGLSQARLAELLGVTRSACAQWERADGTRPRGQRMTRLAQVLGVSVEWLSTGRDGKGSRMREQPPSYAEALTGEERELLSLYGRLDASSRDALLVLLRGRSRGKR